MLHSMVGSVLDGWMLSAIVESEHRQSASFHFDGLVWSCLVVSAYEWVCVGMCGCEEKGREGSGIK